MTATYEKKPYERKFQTVAGASAFASYMVKPWPTFVTDVKITKVHLRGAADPYAIEWIVSWNGKY